MLSLVEQSILVKVETIENKLESFWLSFYLIFYSLNFTEFQKACVIFLKKKYIFVLS